MKKRVLSILICVSIILGILSAFSFSSSAEGETTYQIGDIVEYGSYPQSLVTDESLLADLNSEELTWTSYNYQYGNRDKPDCPSFSIVKTTVSSYPSQVSDYMRYADIEFEGERYRAVTFSSYRPTYFYMQSNDSNSLQDNNGYYINEVYWFKFEPIRWIVLDPQAGMLLPEKIIDGQSFVKSWTKTETYHWSSSMPYDRYWYDFKTNGDWSCKWNNSDLKIWWQNFIVSNFTTNEQNNINDIGILSKAMTLNDTYGFSPSETSQTSRYTDCTEYAKCQGAPDKWWLSNYDLENEYGGYNETHYKNSVYTAGRSYGQQHAAAICGVRLEIIVSDISQCKLVKTSNSGAGIISIEKINTNGGVDTYTIYLTDGSQFVFSVTNGTKGQDGVGIASADINESGELVITLTDSSKLNLGVVKGADGADGQNGENGADGRGIVSIELDSSNGNIDTYVITYTDDTTSTFTITNGVNGNDGQNGQNGADGVGIRSAAVNTDGELIIILTDGTNLNLGNIKGSDGQNGTDGQDGSDGITPQLKIGEDNCWYVSYDNGNTWESLGVKATGEAGQNGKDGNDGKDGITPQLRINEETGIWEVSYDNGETWSSLNVKATGENGSNGADGVGIDSTEINDDGELIITLTNGKTFNLGKITGSDGKDGKDGEQGEKGDKGDKGEAGQDGKDGADGKDGKDGATITSMYYNSNGELVIKMSDGSEINAGKPSGENSNASNNAGTTIDKPTVTITGYQESRSIDYGATITFHSRASYIPDGCRLRWYVNGEERNASSSLTIENATSDFTVCAKLVKNGSVISESKAEKVTVKSDFFSRIVAFFKKLFNRNALIIDQK